MKLVRWLALLIGVALLWFSAWIYLPAPTYFLLTFSVGAPEISHWIVLVATIAALFTAGSLRASRLSAIAFALNAAALVLALGLWLRVPNANTQFASAASSHIVEPRNPRRTSPIVFADLFRGVATGNARLSKRVPVEAIDNQQLTADIYAPPRHGLFPIVVQIYGGAWQRGTPASNAQFATWLAASGYLVVAIDYRHAPANRWPAQIDDVDEALRWVVAHATDYDGDTSRVALLGRSSGAHLATYAAWITTPIHLRGVVSFYGPADLVSSYRNPPSPDPIGVRAVEEALLGGSLQSMPERYAQASTITHLATLGHPTVPSLLIYGGRDHIVEPKYGGALTTALAATGGDVTYLEIPWADHAFDEVFSGPSSQISLYYVERFLARVMLAAR